MRTPVSVVGTRDGDIKCPFLADIESPGRDKPRSVPGCASDEVCCRVITCQKAGLDSLPALAKTRRMHVENPLNWKTGIGPLAVKQF
jgi:hypothetical protein